MHRLLRTLLCTAILSPLAANALDSVPQAEYHQRREKVGTALHGGAALLFAAPEPLLDFMPYRQDSDFYYLTGWQEPGAALLILGDGPATVLPRLNTEVPAHPYREILFLPERSLVMEKYTGKKLDANSPDAKTKTGFQEVMPLSAMPQVLAAYIAEDRRRGNSVYMQPENASSASLLRFTATALGVDNVPASHDIDSLITPLRSIKSPAEIALLKKAADASIAGQLAGMKAIKPGVNERTVAGIEIAAWMANGCERPSYAPIVGSGPNTTTLHYSANSRVMEKGDVVTIDAACEYSMYASDITRAMPVGGHFTARQKEIYDIVLGAQTAAAQAFVSGHSRIGNVNERGSDVNDTLDKVAYDYINTHGKDLHGQPLGQYFLHGLGHSVGLDVHDPYDPKKPLVPGSVFTIEPGIYIPEEKIGIRIEDTFYVDADGKLVDMMTSLPHQATEIETTMR